jgi:DNA-directed RNA polymerase specialized sigma24 family protein
VELVSVVLGPKDYQKVSTHELLLRYKEGEDTALGALYARYANKFYWSARSARKGSLAHADADDAVQKTFERIMDKIGNYNESKHGGASWVWSIHSRIGTDIIRIREGHRGPPPPEPLDVGKDLPQVGAEPEDDWVAPAKKEMEERRCRAIALMGISGKDRAELEQGPGRGTGRKTYYEAVERGREIYQQCLEDSL